MLRTGACFSFLALALLGCSSPGDKKSQSSSREVRVETNAVNLPGGKPVVKQVDVVRGKVVSVNPALRFVVVDFPNQKLPLLDQKLSLYRLDLKVAEIKISGPYRGTTVVADITAGEARDGDLARTDY